MAINSSFHPLSIIVLTFSPPTRIHRPFLLIIFKQKDPIFFKTPESKNYIRSHIHLTHKFCYFLRFKAFIFFYLCLYVKIAKICVGMVSITSGRFPFTNPIFLHHQNQLKTKTHLKNFSIQFLGY